MTYGYQVTSGGSDYYILFENGQSVLKVDEYRGLDVPGYEMETLFSGHYDECADKLVDILADNIDYDMGI